LSDHQATLPRSVDALKKLPGIGPYTAGAIASIAHNVETPVVDGNVERVLCRVYGLAGDPKRPPLRDRLWELAARLHGSEPPADLNQALMELGALVCRPQQADCAHCPIRRKCRAQREGRVDALPTKQPRPALTALRTGAAIVERRGKWLMLKSPEGRARWAGLWQFPHVELEPREPARKKLALVLAEHTGLSVSIDAHLVTLRHSVTRYRITLEAYRGEAQGRLPRATVFKWCTPDQLESLALPAPHRKLANLIIQRER
jgi:A/G-specific adenine glycosylase